MTGLGPYSGGMGRSQLSEAALLVVLIEKGTNNSAADSIVMDPKLGADAEHH